ncbi:MAG: hypothetical protein R2857_04365 [Vampirovibrionales bacterium]
MGDLDRDGLPDALLDQSNDDDVNMMTLFMSPQLFGHSHPMAAAGWHFKAVGCPRQALGSRG